MPEQAGGGEEERLARRFLRLALSRASTRNLIERHTPHLVEDYDSLVTLADLEFGSPPHEDQQDRVSGNG
jgi:hypothetical protein